MGCSRAKLSEQFSLWTRWGRRAVLGLMASLRLLTGYLTGWNSKTTHVYAPPYGFTPQTPPKRYLAGTRPLCGRSLGRTVQKWDSLCPAVALKANSLSKSHLTASAPIVSFAPHSAARAYATHNLSAGGKQVWRADARGRVVQRPRLQH